MKQSVEKKYYQTRFNGETRQVNGETRQVNGETRQGDQHLVEGIA